MPCWFPGYTKGWVVTPALLPNHRRDPLTDVAAHLEVVALQEVLRHVGAELVAVAGVVRPAWWRCSHGEW